jgi:hypothetical protein
LNEGNQTSTLIDDLDAKMELLSVEADAIVKSGVIEEERAQRAATRALLSEYRPKKYHNRKMAYEQRVARSKAAFKAQRQARKAQRGC